MSQHHSVNEYFDQLSELNPHIKKFSQITNESPEKLKLLGIADVDEYDSKRSLVFECQTEPQLNYSNGKPVGLTNYRITFAIGFVLNGNSFVPRLIKNGNCLRPKYFLDSNFIDMGYKIPTQIEELREDSSYIFLENGVDDIRDNVCLDQYSDQEFNDLPKPFILRIDPIEESVNKELMKKFLQLDIDVARKMIDVANKANTRVINYLSVRGGSIDQMQKYLDKLDI